MSHKHFKPFPSKVKKGFIEAFLKNSSRFDILDVFSLVSY